MSPKEQNSAIGLHGASSVKMTCADNAQLPTAVNNSPTKKL